MIHEQLFNAYHIGDVKLSNRIVMAALTRARATNPELVPGSLNATYYAQRASAGLIITESVWVSRQAIGFLNIPGIFSEEQVLGWQEVTAAVHRNNGKIFVQLVHSGAVSHPYYFNGELPYGPSAVNPMEKVFIPEGFTDTMIPRAFDLEAIQTLLLEYRQAALNAREAGFDGIELHAQLFTLIPQFLSASTNQRTDQYGGSIVNRCRILLEILDELIDIFPDKQVGIKFTPAAFNNGIIRPDEDTVKTFEYLLEELNRYDLAFIEVVGPRLDLSGTPLSDWQNDFFGWFRSRYHGTLIANLGFTAELADDIIKRNKADLVSFGTPFIANPDLVERLRNSWPLAEPDGNTFYSGDEKGYADYPEYKS